MIAVVKFDTSSVLKGLNKLEDILARVIIKKGADAGGEVLVKAYRKALEDHHNPKKEAGTYRSARGTVEHFIAAYQAVGQRSLLYKDRTGAYSVVGIVAAADNWRPLAPQATFMESGTDERYHKDDTRTGRIKPPLKILEKVTAEFSQAAQDRCVEVIRTELVDLNVTP